MEKPRKFSHKKAQKKQKNLRLLRLFAAISFSEVPTV